MLPASMYSGMFGGGMPQMSTGYPASMGGVNPYAQQMSNPYSGFGNFGGFGNTMSQPPAYQPQGGYQPMMFGNGYLDQFQAQLNDMFSKYFQNQQVSGQQPTSSGAAGEALKNSQKSTDLGTAPAPLPQAPVEPETPDFGNLGARFGKGKTLTRKAGKKLNKMGYTDDQIIQARQAGGGMTGFQSALGGMQPGA